MSDQKKDAKHRKITPEEELKKLQDEIQRLKNETEDNKNKYLRALADYQNLENRVIVQKEELRNQANRQLLLKLLPVLDAIEKATVFVKDPGLQIVKKNIISLLHSEGVEELQVLGKVFDPFNAEAIQTVEGKQDHMVVEVLNKGYSYRGTILRVAQVTVSKLKIIS